MRTVVIVALVVTGFSSCVQKRYIHSAAPVLNPLFKEKGEGFAGAYYSTNGDTKTTENTDVSTSTTAGVTIQGGYAFSKHIGFAGAFNYMNQNDNYNGSYSDPFNESKIKYNRTEFTLAADYFMVNRSKTTGLNLLVGTTTGKLKLSDAGIDGTSNYSRFFNSNSLMLFVQPCLNFYVAKNTAFGFSTRINYVSYQNNQTNYTPFELEKLRLNSTSALYVAELGTKLSFGFDNFPLNFEPQLNYIWNHSGRIHVKRTNLSLGLAYRFK